MRTGKSKGIKHSTADKASEAGAKDADSGNAFRSSRKDESSSDMSALNAGACEHSLAMDREKTRDDLIAELQMLRVENARLQEDNEILRANEERAQVVISESPIGISLCDASGQCIATNDAMGRIIGGTKEDVLRQNYHDLESWKVSGLYEKTLKAIKEKSTQRHEVRVKTTFGKDIFLDCYMIPLASEGLLFMGQDITEQVVAERELEEKEILLSALIEQSPIPMTVAAPDGTLRFVNNACLEFYGVEDVTGAGSGLNLFKIKPPWKDFDLDGNAVPLEGLPLALSLQGKVTKNMEMRVLRADGTERWKVVDAAPIYNKDGELIAGFVIFPDITGRKHAEQNVHNALREREVLLAEIHHRVKNNLAVISSMLEMQSCYIEDQKFRQIFRECQSRISSMALVHEHLYGSDDFANVDLNNYIDKLIRMLSMSYLTQGRLIRIYSEIDPIDLGMDQLISVGMIITEAVTNSIKYAFGDGDEGVINVALRAGDNHMMLTIGDNGSGLPDGLDPGRTSTFGFKLMRIFARQLKGTLDLRSDGNGTMVTVRVEGRGWCPSV